MILLPIRKNLTILDVFSQDNFVTLACKQAFRGGLMEGRQSHERMDFRRFSHRLHSWLIWLLYNTFPLVQESYVCMAMDVCISLYISVNSYVCPYRPVCINYLGRFMGHTLHGLLRVHLVVHIVVVHGLGVSKMY